MSKYEYEQFGVGYVGEKRPENSSKLYEGDEEGDEDLDEVDNLGAGGGPQHRYKYVNSARDFTLPLQKHPNVQPMYESPVDEEISVRKYLGVSVGLVSLITENLLSHPFLVLRRQCQVHHNSSRWVAFDNTQPGREGNNYLLWNVFVVV